MIGVATKIQGKEDCLLRSGLTPAVIECFVIFAWVVSRVVDNVCTCVFLS